MEAEILEEYRAGGTMLEISQRHGMDLFDVREILNDKKLLTRYEMDLLKLCRSIHTAQPPEDGFARKRCMKTNCRWRRDGACICVLPRCFHSL